MTTEIISQDHPDLIVMLERSDDFLDKIRAFFLPSRIVYLHQKCEISGLYNPRELLLRSNEKLIAMTISEGKAIDEREFE